MILHHFQKIILRKMYELEDIEYTTRLIQRISEIIMETIELRAVDGIIFRDEDVNVFKYTEKKIKKC